jgi:hypothetical protein
VNVAFCVVQYSWEFTSATDVPVVGTVGFKVWSVPDALSATMFPRLSKTRQVPSDSTPAGISTDVDISLINWREICSKTHCPNLGEQIATFYAKHGGRFANPRLSQNAQEMYLNWNF